MATTWTAYCISTHYPVANEAKGSIVKGLMGPSNTVTQDKTSFIVITKLQLAQILPILPIPKPYEAVNP